MKIIQRASTIACAVLAVILCLVLMPTEASAEEYSGICGENLTWTLNEEGVLTISGTGSMETKPWSEYANDIKKVVIENGVTSIGSYAFQYCSGLTSITIPSSVESIGWSAFSDCSSLTSITIPRGVTSIEGGAFWGCSSLTSITISSSVESIGNNAFHGCTGLQDVYIDDLTSWCVMEFGKGCASPMQYAENLYVNGELLTELVIPDGVTSIDATYLSNRCNCKSLKSIILPDSVVSIEDYAFENCSSLTSITIPSSVESIGYNAFYGCTSLQDVYIDDLTSWCEMEFGNDYATPMQYAENLYVNGELLTELVIPDGVTSIEYNYLCDIGCKNLESIILPDSVVTIEDYAFGNCSSLTSITIPSSVESIGYNAFYGCTGLQNVYIEDIAAWCKINFDNSYATPMCYAENFYVDGELLTELVIPDGVTSIGTAQFLGFSKVTSIILPDSVVTIEDYAFEYCSSLTSITIPSDVTSIGRYAFGYCTGLISITIPSSVESIGYNAFYGSTRLLDIYIEDIASWCKMEFDNGHATPMCYAGNLYMNGELLTELVIPDGVTGIGSNAFQNCSALISITIPSSVESIGYYAFYGCTSLQDVYTDDLASWCKIEFGDDYATPMCYAENLYVDGELLSGDLVIPEGVTSCGDFAFYNCQSLTSVSVPSSVTEIAYGAFGSCSNLTAVSIADGVTGIGVEAFKGCSSLTSIEIPKSMKTIGIFAFFDCTSLKDVYIEDLASWCEIECTAWALGNPMYFAEHLYLNGKLLEGELVIPAGVTKIVGYSFNNCKGLTNVIIPDGVSIIKERAFAGCSNLKSISIPDSVNDISWGAFSECVNLQTVYYSGTAEDWANVSISDSGNEPLNTAEIICTGDVRFNGASVTLEDDLSANYKINQEVLAENGYEDPYVVYTLNGVETKVTDYSIIDGQYVFTFCNIAPSQMSDTITATIYVSHEGVELECQTKEYSMAEYCYNLLEEYSGDTHAPLRTLLVDMLNYGAAAQAYTGHNADAPVNADLTEEQKAWGTSGTVTLTTVRNTAYKTVETPQAVWKGAGLVLRDSVTMRFKLAAESVEDLSVKIESGEESWNISADAFVKDGEVYYVYFDGLNAGQMRQNVYLTVCEGETPVSNTVCYSIESYAYQMQNSEDEALAALVNAMMKYGDAAYVYAN